MSTLQENLDRIKKAKSAIKDAIIQKGIDVTDTEKIETYADKILQIKSGGGTEIPEFDPDGPLTIYCFDDWGDAYVSFDAQYVNYVTQYSTDGTTWKSYSNRQDINLKKGEYVQFKCSFQRNTTDTTRFTMKNGLFNLYGNITSLNNYKTTVIDTSPYIGLFSGTNVYDCSKLNLSNVLTAKSNTYKNLFNSCIYLAFAPALPATTLKTQCYYGMFQNCTSLTKAPALPATTLITQCYTYMFQNCTSLTTIPKLPAQTLKMECYAYMFQNCTSLVETPGGWYLPAQTIDSGSCYEMFYGCSKLRKMAVAYSGTIDLTSQWHLFMYGVSSTGTFYYSKNQTKENIQSIVPSGWTLTQSSSW